MFPVTSPVLVLVGPTAIGKTDLSIELAKKFNCEIISMDSMQVYKYMDIGTAKITEEEMAGIPHHLLSIVEPDEDYDAANFARDACAAITAIIAQEKIPLITGGTGLYLKSLTEGLFSHIPEFPEIRQNLKERITRDGLHVLHEELIACDHVSGDKINANDRQRVLRGLEIFLGTGTPWSTHIARQQQKKHPARFTNLLQIGLTTERERLYDRINRRTTLMLERGLEQEVRGLLDRGYSEELKSMNSIGYRHMVNYICDRWTQEETERLLARDTRRYAKRQYTWFNHIDQLEWMDVENRPAVTRRVQEWLDDTRVAFL